MVVIKGHSREGVVEGNSNPTALGSKTRGEGIGIGDGLGTNFEELDQHDSGPEEVFVVSGVFNDGGATIRQERSFMPLKGLHTFRDQQAGVCSSCSNPKAK